ncbi:MAG TPA: transglutaminase domain-containing protein [Cyclobacteriaceae bacterium]
MTSFRCLLTGVLWIGILFCVSAQKNTNKERASALKQIFKDTKVAASNYSTAYEFELNGSNLLVEHTEDLSMISLEGNVNYNRTVFYNDHIKINEGEVKYASGKKIPVNKSCGNYEVEDIFYSDSKVCSYQFNFLHEGTEIDFKSNTTYDDARYFTKVFFHEDIPVAEREIRFSIPNSVQVELVEKNFAGFDIKKNITKEGSNTIYTYTVKNLKAFKSENNSLGFLYYYPHLIVVTKEYTTSSGRKAVIASVNDLYGWYAGLVKEVKNDPSALKEEVNKLVATAKTPEEKIKAIYYWVQDNIKYIAFEDGIAGFKPEAAQQVLYNRYGDCKGMANLTKEMLKVAGFDARLTWIGTKRIPYTYDLPSLAVDNHMICTVFLNEKQFILDPTEKYIALGKHAERIQGKEILIEDKDKFILKKVPVAGAEQNQVTQEESITIEGETLKGQGQMTINGESKKNILYYSTNIKQEDQKKLYDNLVVSDYGNQDKVEVTNAPPVDRDKAMEVKYNYTLNNKITRFEKDVYVEVDWNKMYKSLTMKDDRESDYYFNRKVNTKVVKKLKVPAGYKVTHLPKNMSRKHVDFSFAVTFEQKGTELIYTNQIIIPNGLVKKADFKIWNDYIKELDDVYNDQIVLTKLK